MLISEDVKDAFKFIILPFIGIILFICTTLFSFDMIEKMMIVLHNKGAKLRIERIKLDIEEYKLRRQRHKALNTDIAVYKSEYKAPEETDKDKDKQK